LQRMKPKLTHAFFGLGENVLLTDRALEVDPFILFYEKCVKRCNLYDLSPKFPPALRGVLGVKSLSLSGHFVHHLSLQEFHRSEVAQG